MPDDTPEPAPAQKYRLEDITTPCCYVCDQPADYHLIRPNGKRYRGVSYCWQCGDRALRKLNGED